MAPDLSIDISTTSNSKILRIKDTSIFYSMDDPENFILEVLSPVSSKWVTFNVNKEFDMILNASSLKIQKAKASTKLSSIPDGIYTVRMSVKPNFATLTEFLHLRTKQFQDRYDTTLANLYSERCSILRREFLEQKRKLVDILMDIKAAKVAVEVLQDKEKGIALYEKAAKDLKTFSDECGCW